MVMVAVRLLAATLVGAMVAAIGAGSAAGGFLDDGRVLLDLVWGRVTLVDIYAAFLVGWLWIALRERSAVRAALWLPAVAITGSLALAVYLLGAAIRADDPEQLFLGPHRRPTPVAGA
ncbi:hypothetical protein [Nitriliruptor alkaliphilus]|uniref:hypothetical protein n=1 Tax=Nitriliruptor alkaliphilus TaxID=427918 RepID=UPI0006972127|nr:hypothetical protein [Nitriliruptor alkaliphilus]